MGDRPVGYKGKPLCLPLWKGVVHTKHSRGMVLDVRRLKGRLF